MKTTKTEERKPVFESIVDLPATKGFYIFFCKSTATIFQLVLSLLSMEELKTELQWFKLVTCIWIVNHNNNKLEGISSISSSVCDNLLCKARQALKNCICKFCYAYNQQSYQDGLKEHNIINGIILRNVLIPVKTFKHLKILYPYLRIESFGDVQNITQARNYIRIIKAFPEKRSAIWSKNIEIWNKAFQLEGKPKNTTYIHSSRELNKPDSINREKYPFIDHVFTVYTKEFIKQNNIIINCGGKKCMECILKKKNCYYRLSKGNDTFYINEQKK